MFFRRGQKLPLEYALNFVELAGETARYYLHDKDYMPTAEVMAQLRELKKSMGMYHSALGYIIRTLEERANGDAPTPND